MKRHLAGLGLLAGAFAVVSACAGPSGPQGGGAATPSGPWGPASAVTFDGAPTKGDNADVVLDELAILTTAEVPIIEQSRYCGRAVTGVGTGDWGGFSGGACAGVLAASECQALTNVHPCTVDDLIRNYLLTPELLDLGMYVYDPTTCLGLRSAASSDMGLSWLPGIGFVHVPCDQIDALACCGS